MVQETQSEMSARGFYADSRSDANKPMLPTLAKARAANRSVRQEMT